MRRFFQFSYEKCILVALFIITILVSMAMYEKNIVLAVQVHEINSLTGITASVDNASPSQNTNVNVNVTGPAGGKVMLVCHFRTGDFSYSGEIGDDGRVEIPVWIGAALPGYAVYIDVSVTADKTYETQTMFVPQ